MSTIGKAALLLAGIAGGFVLAGGAEAGEGRGEGRWGRKGWGPYYVVPGPPVVYAPRPKVVYAAPPVVYAAPPPVMLAPAYPAVPVYPAYPAPGLNLNLSLPLR